MDILKTTVSKGEVCILAANRNFIKASASVPELVEVTGDAAKQFEASLESYPFSKCRSLLQIPGGRAMGWFSKLALAMGVGTVAMWLPVPQHWASVKSII